MSRQSDLYCPHCGVPQLKSLSVEQCAKMLDCSTDFIRDHIKNGTIDSIGLRSPKQGVTRQLTRIPVIELLKIVEQRPGLVSMIEEVLTEKT